MSTQLILLPQTHLGVSSGTGGVELVSDGSQFFGMNSAAIHTVGTASPLNTLMASPPVLFPTNTWVRWKTGTGSIWLTPADPQQVTGDIELNTVGDITGKSSGSGVIQKLAGLSVGTNYTIELDVSLPTPPLPSPNHHIKVVVYNGSNIIHNHVAAAGFHGVLTTTFTAQSTNDIITVSNYDNVDNDIEINYISVKGSTVQTLGAGNGQVICDLYQEEDIPLTLSIDDFKNVSEQVKSYSKDFNLPATKRNNRIFNNMFDVTRADDGVIFNPYVKTACLLKQDGFIIFEGYLKLINVKDKEGEISYNVNLYSEVIALADVLKDRTFSQLDFSELNHTYDRTNIRNSWHDTGSSIAYLNPNTSGFRQTYKTLRYPFIDWNHQLSSDASGNPVLPNLEAVFRPCIKLEYLIQKIFAATDFNYTSSFFDSADFDKLYMDFNWGGDNAPVVFNAAGIVYRNTAFTPGTSFVTIDFDVSLPPTFPSEFGYSAGVFTAQTDNQTYNIYFTIEFGLQGLTTPPEQVTVQWVVNGVPQNLDVSPSLGPGDSWIYVGNFAATLDSGDTILCQAKSTGAYAWAIGGQTSVTATTSSNETTSTTLLQTLRGELEQWDFLKGIMKMFNLVSMRDENNPNNILIEPYNDIFLTNPNIKELDWTDKVDVSEMELKPLTDLNKNTIFQFAEDEDDYTFMQYKQGTGGHLYGSKKRDASASGTTTGRPTTLQGTKEIVAEPFAATISKQYYSQWTDLIVPTIYAMNDDGASEGFDNLPRIFYNNGVRTLQNHTYYIPAQNGGGAVSAEDKFLQFSHLTEIPSVSTTTTDFVFESSQLFQGVGNSPIDNLFNTYWARYFHELYHADTRTMTLKVILSPSDIATFNFYDKIFIRNRIFRVNKIEYKPNSLAKVEFILIP